MASSVGPVTMDGPPGVESLIFLSMRGVEELGLPFQYDLELLSEDFNVKAADMLGQTMAVHLELGDGSLRHFHGYITEFSAPGSTTTHASYRVMLRPWIWFLSRTTNCRIFQSKTVPDIIKEVFRAHDLTDFEESLTSSYSARTFVVQYRETDLNFVSRLMEQEGIYFFFKHTASTHTLVLADSYSAHDTSPGYEKVPYFPPDEHRNLHIDHINHWSMFEQIEPGAYAHTDYNFEKPAANLLRGAKLSSPFPMGNFEIYDYPGGYEDSSAGEAYARVRLEELHATAERLDGEANARGLAVGSLFQLTEHPRDEQNREYLIISANYVIRSHDPRSTSDHSEVFRCSFSAIEAARPYRAPRRARKAIVRGAQTATVVGHGGEEIWTDNYGRVKVKFHWDRADGADESSSCWLRVAQVWAGGAWGAMHIPRIGQEVIVEFLEGDPDRPIVTGRVYNGQNPVPYGLPGNQTQSGIKSRSTKGGDAANFNELRFEDKKGSEEIFVQAEKDLDTLVKNDETRAVGHDQAIEIGHDRKKTVKNDETVTVDGNRSETVGKNESIDIGASRSETVAMTETISVGAARSTTIGAADELTVGGLQSVSVGASRSISVGGSESTSIGGSRTIDVAKNESTSIGQNRSAQVGKDEDLSVQGKRTQSIEKDDVLQVKKKIEIMAGEEILIKTGDATIQMKKNGDITIKGKNITLDGSGKVNVKASSDVIVKGSKISQN